jgi:hypothetical protein
MQKIEDELNQQSLPPPHKFTVDIMKEKHNLQILKFFEHQRTARKLEKELVKKYDRDKKIETRIHENQEGLKKKKEEIFNKHQEKLKKLFIQRKIQEDIILEKINRTPLSRKKMKNQFKEKKVFSLTCEEKDIETKLQEFNRKLLKSSENYNRNLVEKVETLKKHSRRRNTLDEGNEYDHKVIMFNTKLTSAVSRRKKIQSQLKERIHEKEARFLLKSEKIRKKNVFESELQEPDKSLSDNEEKVEKFLVCIKPRKKDSNDTKLEKLKNLEANLHQKIKNMKKLDLEKKEKILEKHIQLDKKHQEHKESLELANKTIRAKAMNFTIEKEKALAIKCQVAKSQSPEDLERLLEKYKTSF